MLTAGARVCRREGHRAAKDSAKIEAFDHTGRQEAAGRAEEAERAADHGRRGGQHVPGGRERVALQRSQRSVLLFFLDPLCGLWWATDAFVALGVLVHAAVTANTFAIYGAGQVKELTELVPGILNQLGPDSLASLRKLAESYQAIQQGQQRGAAAAPEDDDDDVPDLVENFDVEEQKKDNTLEELN